MRRLSLWVLLTLSVLTACTTQDSFREFDTSKHMQFVKDIFKKDIYWLVATEEIPDFSVDKTFTYALPSEDPKYWGKLISKVFYEKNEPIGFVSYYKKRPYRGVILFVSIKEEYKGKGYSKKLVKYACKELKNMGCKSVELVTRTNNIRAINLYTGLGFKEYRRDEGFIDFEKKL